MRCEQRQFQAAFKQRDTAFPAENERDSGEDGFVGWKSTANGPVIERLIVG